MARAYVNLRLVYPDGTTDEVNNLEHKDVEYEVSQQELQRVYVDQLKSLAVEANTNGIAIWSLGDQVIPIKLTNFPKIELTINTVSRE